MQSTGQTSTHASQPVQLSARTTANSLGSFLRALPAPLAMIRLSGSAQGIRSYNTRSASGRRDGLSPILLRQTLEGVAELGGRLVAQVGVALDRLEQERAGRLVEVGAQFLGVLAGTVHVAEQRLERLRLFPRQGLREDFVRRDAQREQVNSVVGDRAPDDLGGQVVGRAGAVAGLAELRPVRD